MQINKKQILEICKVSWAAGKKILKIYSKKFKIFRKKDKSPVTLADLESEKTIIKGLKEIFKKPVIFSEETNYKNIGNSNSFWLVDPLDGTKDFIKNKDQLIKVQTLFKVLNRRSFKGYLKDVNEDSISIKLIDNNEITNIRFDSISEAYLQYEHNKN